MNKDNIMETLLSIGMFVIILVWFLVVHKLFVSIDIIRDQCGKNMNDITEILVMYDTKIKELKTTINKQQSTIEQLEERIETLEVDNRRLTKRIDTYTLTEED